MQWVRFFTNWFLSFLIAWMPFAAPANSLQSHRKPAGFTDMVTDAWENLSEFMSVDNSERLTSPEPTPEEAKAAIEEERKKASSLKPLERPAKKYIANGQILSADTLMFDRTGHNPTMEVADLARATKGESTLGKLGYKMEFDRKKKEAVFRKKGSDGKDILISFPYNGPEEENRKFAPKKLLQEFVARMKQAKPGEAFRGTLARFPKESLMFFVAIGAVMAVQMFTDYSGNPARLQQHVEHSISPVGMFSFFAFMYVNGVTHNALLAWLKNPKFHPFIPYLSMSAGFFVQSFIAGFAADPNVKACVAQFLGKKQTEEELAAQQDSTESACEKAFNYYAIKRMIWEMAPGLVSMLGSTLLAGLLQKGLTSLVLKFTGVDIALWFFPGGVGIQAVRFLVVNALQMGAFYAIDANFLNRLVTYRWKAFWDGNDMNAVEKEIVENMIKKKQNLWSDDWNYDLSCTTLKKDRDCFRDFAHVLRDFSDKSSSWRMTNLSEIYEAHQGWTIKLAKINGMYDAAKEFYSEFILEARNSKFKKFNPQRLELVSPLFGIVPDNLPEENMGSQYTRPERTEPKSSDTAIKIGEWLKRLYDANKDKFFGAEEKKLNAIISGLLKTDVNEQGKAILLLNNEFNRVFGEYDPETETIGSVMSLGGGDGVGDATSGYMEFLRAAKESIGPDAMPLMDKGRGFLRGFEKWTKNAKTISSLEHPKYRGLFTTPHVTDYMVMQMLCGPDVDRGESLVWSPILGGADEFHPPKIVNDLSSAITEVCEPMTNDPLPAQEMYKRQFKQGNQNYIGVLDVVKNSIRPNIFGDEDESGFDKWWQQKTHERMKLTYEQFARDYDEIVAKLVHALNRTDERFASFSTGPLAAGVIKSIRQEMRLNLMVVGELYKDIYKQQKGDLPQKLFNSAQEPQLLVSERIYKEQEEQSDFERSQWQAHCQNVIETTATRIGGDPNAWTQAHYDKIAKREPKCVTIMNLKSPDPAKAIPPVLNYTIVENLPLLKALVGPMTYGHRMAPATTSVLEWNRIVSYFPSLPASSKEIALGKQMVDGRSVGGGSASSAPLGYALQIQKEIEYEFEKLVWLFSKIKVREVCENVPRRAASGIAGAARPKDTIERVCHQAIFSELENEDIRKAGNLLNAKLSRFSQMLGAGENSVKGSGLTLTKEQNEIAVGRLEAILNLANELTLYATMANSVSWDKIQKLKESQLSESQKALQNEMMKKAAQISASLIGGN